MKKFRKNKEGYFICEECEKNFKLKKGLSKHIKCKHGDKFYYDKWLKENNEEICPICKKLNIFYTVGYGYTKTCGSSICYHKLSAISSNSKWIKLYGMHPKQTLEVKQRCIDSNLKNYGVKYMWERNDIVKKIRKNNLINHGGIFSSASKECIDKSKKTRKEKYGDENYTNQEKFEQTCLENYGVKRPLQNQDIFQKQQRTAYYSKKFRNTNINYRGSYELDFLEKYYDKYTDIINAPSIEYIIENKEHIYFPDFYIPSLNLIVECKNSYLAKKDKDKIKIKENATISNGHNYIIIVNKNYIEFEKLWL